MGLLVSLGSTVSAQYNPNGQIRNDGWNMIVPLLNPDGCGGGGTGKMAGKWVGPFDTLTGDPKAGQTHDGLDLPLIDFGGAALAGGWGAADYSSDPIWFSLDFLEVAFGLDVGALGGPIPRFDRLSWQDQDGGNSLINWLNANVGPVIGAAALPGDNVMGIATTYVRNNGAPTLAYACMGSDDSIRVDVNNKTIHNNSTCRGSGDCQDIKPFFLPGGVSKITIMVWEGGGGFDGRLGIRLTPSAANLKDGDGSGIEFLGPGGPNDVGQLVYGADRSTSRPYECVGAGNVTVRVVGSGPGADGDVLTVEESVFAPDGSNITIANVSNGGVVSDIAPPVRMASDAFDARKGPVDPFGVFTGHEHVGLQCGPLSETTFNGVDGGGRPMYTSISNTGGDLWDCSNDFEFAYNQIEGNFDVSVKETSKVHDSGAGRWGKFGLIARHHIDGLTRHSIIQDHLPDLQDARSFSNRNSYGGCGPMNEDRNTTGPAVSAHPPYYRLKRDGNTFTGWASDDPTVEADPYNDSLWTKIGNDNDWGADAPAKVFVGFANSEHNSGGCNVQTIDFTVIGAKISAFPATIGKKITWTVPRSAVTAGLSYEVGYSKSGSVGISGAILGESITLGPGSVPFNTSNQPLGEGPCSFDGHADIGTPPTAGSASYAAGTYTVSGSGGDIWDGGDQGHFAYKVVTGDFRMACRVTDANTANYRWGRYGLMARRSCDPCSEYAMALNPYSTADIANGLEDPKGHQSRRDHLTCGNTRGRQKVTGAAYASMDLHTGWMRLTRVGQYFYSEFAADNGGTPGEWNYAGGSQQPTMPDTILVGMISSSHGSAGANLLTIKFDNLTCDQYGPEQQTCSAGETILSEDNETGGSYCSAASNNYVPNVAATPAGLDPGVFGAGVLQTSQQATGGTASTAYISLDGLNLGDTAFEVSYDLGIVFDYNAPPGIEADGSAVSITEATCADVTGRFGGGGGGLSYVVGCHYCCVGPGGNECSVSVAPNALKSFATEDDTWDGGADSNDPPGGYGANAGGRRWHTGIDFHEEYQSAQNDVEFGAAYANGIINNSKGVHRRMTYEPLADGEHSRIETFLSFNDGSLAEIKVGSVVGPRLFGDVVLGIHTGTGGATQDTYFDNITVKKLCCEGSPETVSIADAGGGGNHTGDTGSTVTLHASAGGLDGPAAYTWSVVSEPAPGAATLTPAGADCGVSSSADGVVTVKVTVDDGKCGNQASASHDVTFSTPGQLRRPNDENEDGKMDLSDAVGVLNYLFTGTNPTLSCGDGTRDDAANKALLDANGDGKIDLSDPVRVLKFLFSGDPQPVNCTGSGATVNEVCPCILIRNCGGSNHCTD